MVDNQFTLTEDEVAVMNEKWDNSFLNPVCNVIESGAIAKIEDATRQVNPVTIEDEQRKAAERAANKDKRHRSNQRTFTQKTFRDHRRLSEQNEADQQQRRGVKGSKSPVKRQSKPGGMSYTSPIKTQSESYNPLPDDYSGYQHTYQSHMSGEPSAEAEIDKEINQTTSKIIKYIVSSISPMEVTEQQMYAQRHWIKQALYTCEPEVYTNPQNLNLIFSIINATVSLMNSSKTAVDLSEQRQINDVFAKSIGGLEGTLKTLCTAVTTISDKFDAMDSQMKMLNKTVQELSMSSSVYQSDSHSMISTPASKHSGGNHPIKSTHPFVLEVMEYFGSKGVEIPKRKATELVRICPYNVETLNANQIRKVCRYIFKQYQAETAP
ncbi:MAG: putative phosphoprotein [Wenzhou bat rhabdovirus 3]|nr:MAG: putative phosphoprotein [Wenzhou bat rhabdovirus 3]